MTGAPRAPTPPLSVAPMMDRTDRHFRMLMRQVTRRTLLYTEMVTTGALLHGPAERLLAHRPEERPLALQLGGDDPDALAACARMAEDAGFDEVNLNVGCPSDRVQRGRFGACLMADPERVAASVAAMRGAVSLPVTVKHRIGVDDRDRYEDLRHFVRVVAAAGADRFTVHARKAWLRGLSPKQNRNVPPLRYADVHRLKREHPRLPIEINGGFRDLDAVAAELGHVDAVMLGRAAYERPLLLACADRRLFGESGADATLRRVVEGYLPYLEEELERGTRLQTLTRHMVGLARESPGARRWRRALSEGAARHGAGSEVVRDALAALPDAALDGEASGSDHVAESVVTGVPRDAPHDVAASPSRRASSSRPSEPR